MTKPKQIPKGFKTCPKCNKPSWNIEKNYCQNAYCEEWYNKPKQDWWDCELAIEINKIFNTCQLDYMKPNKNFSFAPYLKQVSERCKAQYEKKMAEQADYWNNKVETAYQKGLKEKEMEMQELKRTMASDACKMLDEQAKQIFADLDKLKTMGYAKASEIGKLEKKYIGMSSDVPQTKSLRYLGDAK